MITLQHLAIILLATSAMGALHAAYLADRDMLGQSLLGAFNGLLAGIGLLLLMAIAYTAVTGELP